jgi:hypothetical protein
MIVIVLLGILVSVAVPQYFNSVKEARSVQCRANRGAIERTVFHYIETENILAGETTPSISDLIGKNLLSIEPLCQAGGVYFWLDTNVPADGMSRIGCSVHWVP